MFVLYFTLLLVPGSTLKGLPHDGIYNVQESAPSRIFGGADAPEGYAPHMVALLIGVDYFTMFVCGGSIISTKHVLTAAHCINAVLIWWPGPDPKLSSSLRGVIGSNKHTSTENVITFTDFVNHPNWNTVTFKNDVGVLITTQKIKLTDKIAIIPLKTSWVNGGEKCYVTGWGLNSHLDIPKKLQLLYVSTIGGQECVDAIFYASQILGDPPPPPVDPLVEICTLHSPGHGMCNGDSGSALVSTSTGEQVGIVAWGFPCAAGVPDVFVRISGVLDFLKPFIDEN